MPFSSTFLDLFSERASFEFVPKLELTRDVRVELFDKLGSFGWEVVEAFFLEVGMLGEWGWLRLRGEALEGVGLLLLLRLTRVEGEQ